jgi:endo-1,4-beta-xylanase
MWDRPCAVRADEQFAGVCESQRGSDRPPSDAWNRSHVTFQLQSPTLEAIEASLTAFAGAGVEVLVSELDVDVLPPAYQNQGADLSVNAELSAQLNPYPDCLPSEVAEQAAQRWAEIFEVLSGHSDHVHSVTLWGVSDRYSWLNNWPVKGRSNYAQLFESQLRAKQSWQRVIEVAGRPH